MSELETIRRVLERAGLRHRLSKALRGLCDGLLIGAVVCLLVLASYHLWPLPSWSVGLATLVPVVGMVAGFIIGFWSKPSLSEVARWVDSRRHLKERLSTAIEMSGDPNETSWSHLIVSDAAEHAKGIDAGKLLPLHLPRITRWALVVLALGAGLGFVPEYRSKNARLKQTDQQNIKETGRLLAELTRHNLEKRPPAFEPTQK